MWRCSACGLACRPFGYTPSGFGRWRCYSCRKVAIDRSRRRFIPERVSFAAQAGEAAGTRAALAMLRAGVLELRDDLSVWRHARIDKWGRRTPVSPPVRADRQSSNGYRAVFVWVDGRAYGALVHRLAWVHRSGRIAGDHRFRLNRRSPVGAELRPVCASIPRSRAQRQPLSLRWPYIASGKPDPLVSLVNAAVPRELPEHIRAEVCQEVAVAMLLGAELTDALVRKAVRAVWRSYPVLAGHQRSLDAKRPGRDTTLGDMLPA